MDFLRFLFGQCFQTRLNKKYYQFWAERRSRKAFEENIELIKRHNALAKNGTYSYELRPNVMADFVSIGKEKVKRLLERGGYKWIANIVYSTRNFNYLQIQPTKCLCTYFFQPSSDKHTVPASIRSFDTQ